MPARPPLVLRNLTPHALELVAAERFAAERVATGSLLANVSGAIAGLLNATEHSAHRLCATGEPRDVRRLALSLPPFGATRSDVPAPRAGHDHGADDDDDDDDEDEGGAEVLRLTLACGAARFVVDVPAPSQHAVVVENPDAADAPRLTVVYRAAGAVVAVFEDRALDAWMAPLRDDWPLAMLSMPGTHNSPTCYTALPSVRCQAVDVAEQLRHGVRFLDVRVSVGADDADDDLVLVHSAFPISLTGHKYLADLLRRVYAFLDAHPSEALVVSVKREGTGAGDDARLARVLKRAYVDVDAARWWTDPALPTLGAVRGRAVLLRRFALADGMAPWAVDAQHWPDNCADGAGGAGGSLRIQDYYDVAESQAIDAKIAYCRGHLERAAEQAYALPGMPAYRADAAVPPLFVNFLTASSFFNAACWPERIAAKVNPAVVDYLCLTHGDAAKAKVGSGGTGIVITDWVGANDDWDLIRCIVGMNARLQYSA